MHAITVRNPWAYAIAIGRKRIENRGFYPPKALMRLGGLLAIHAGAKIDPQARKPPHQVALRSGVWSCPTPVEMPSSAVVAVVRVVANHHYFHGYETWCSERDRWVFDIRKRIKIPEQDEPISLADDWAYAAWRDYHYTCGWLLADVQRLAEPVPVPGRLGCWRLPEVVEAAVRAQLVDHGG